MMSQPSVSFLATSVARSEATMAHRSTLVAAWVSAWKKFFSRSRIGVHRSVREHQYFVE